MEFSVHLKYPYLHINKYLWLYVLMLVVQTGWGEAAISRWDEFGRGRPLAWGSRRRRCRRRSLHVTWVLLLQDMTITRTTTNAPGIVIAVPAIYQYTGQPNLPLMFSSVSFLMLMVALGIIGTVSYKNKGATSVVLSKSWTHWQEHPKHCLVANRRTAHVPDQVDQYLAILVCATGQLWINTYYDCITFSSSCCGLLPWHCIYLDTLKTYPF